MTEEEVKDSAPKDATDDIRTCRADQDRQTGTTEKDEHKIQATATAATSKVTNESDKPYSAFSGRMKFLIVFMTGCATFFSPLSGQIYYPVLPILTGAYNLSQSAINVSITTYMIFQGLAPSFLGTFSDSSGRRLGYILAFTIYTAANIGLALQSNYAALLILRCLQSAGSSGTVAFGYGVIADIATTAERGKYLGPMMACILTAPAFGPTIGGLLTEYLGWRAVFWFLTIISGAYLVLYIIFVPETQRNIVDDGSIVPQQWWRQSVVQHLAARRRLKSLGADEREAYLARQEELARKQQEIKIRFPNPLNSFVILTNPDAFCIILYMGLAMFANMVLMTSTPTAFPGLYGLNTLQVGLCFLPLGVGAAIGAIINGRVLDFNYRRIAQRLGFAVDRKKGDDLTNFPIETARLQSVFFAQTLQVAAYLSYGWVLDRHVHLAAPLVIQFIIGFCLVIVSNSLSTLLADIYPKNVSTASAASNLFRCLLGAVGAAVVDKMLSGMGMSWAFMFVGLMLVAATSLIVIELKWGMGWRQKRWREAAEKSAKNDVEKGAVKK
ncbi:uncharacterized protein PV09_03101 [Verruconis gallopava]|uniref:Major facilitator superfamily (MFS) profile domain-containing protein n=1 Tax=Verruconis gallopava TaxID=253628 RepID=A0A0D1YYZ0_9PEZI|nr:uncharacterized protein PV09_03101 [Verruconis gallopava]KIW05907.1 hypothetical protein PV09_03101 [Verruconis gallopava]